MCSCEYCGAQISTDAPFCSQCGKPNRSHSSHAGKVPPPPPPASPQQPLYQQAYQPPTQIIIEQKKTSVSAYGIIGFVLALLDFFLIWKDFGFFDFAKLAVMPKLALTPSNIMKLVIVLIGLICSVEGCSKKPRAFGIVGLIFSLINVAMILVVMLKAYSILH